VKGNGGGFKTNRLEFRNPEKFSMKLSIGERTNASNGGGE
jgi:hypothetical protein